MNTPGTPLEKAAVLTQRSKASKVLDGICLVAGAIIAAVSLISVDAYQRLIQEDGIVENLSAISWALAAIAGIVRFPTQKRRPAANRIIACCLILFFIVCGNEEISWGQRIFGFHGPEKLLEINRQHETNLHNIGSISVFSNSFFLLTLIFFIVLPKLKERRVLRGVWQSLPIVSAETRRIYVIGLIVWLFVGLRFGTLGFHPYSLWGYYTQMDDEVFELFAAYSFFVFSVLDFPGDLQEDQGKAVAPP